MVNDGRQARASQLELFTVAARTVFEAAYDGRALEALSALCAARPGWCAAWFSAADIADHAGPASSVEVAEVSAALLRLLYRRAVRRREGPQGVEWTVCAKTRDRCVACDGCGL